MPYFEGSGEKSEVDVVEGYGISMRPIQIHMSPRNAQRGSKKFHLSGRSLWEDSMRNSFCRGLQATFTGMLATGLVLSNFCVQARQADGARPSPQSTTGAPA